VATTQDAAALPCDQQDHFIYQGQCVPKSCLNDKLSRVLLTPLDEFTTNIGKLQLGITYSARLENNANGHQFHVQILYGDQENNQLVADPDNCIDWRVYQTANSYDIDNSRLNVAAEGAKPQWPAATYQFNSASSAGQLDFILSQDDLDAHNCVRLAGDGQVSWECFFEMAFVIKSITQVSYYFSIRVVLDTNIGANSPPAVQFVKIIDIERCPDND
jgi:hypothetical protein